MPGRECLGRRVAAAEMETVEQHVADPHELDKVVG